MRLSFSPRAEADLEEIGDYIALDSPVRALNFVRELRSQAARVVVAPKACPMRPDLAPDIRMLVFRSYLVFYRALDHEVRIERILHSSRDLPGVFGAEGDPSNG